MENPASESACGTPVSRVISAKEQHVYLKQVLMEESRFTQQTVTKEDFNGYRKIPQLVSDLGAGTHKPGQAQTARKTHNLAPATSPEALCQVCLEEPQKQTSDAEEPRVTESDLQLPTFPPNSQAAENFHAHPQWKKSQFSGFLVNLWKVHLFPSDLFLRNRFHGPRCFHLPSNRNTSPLFMGNHIKC